MLWLRGNNDEEPPTLWSRCEDETQSLADISSSIASFSNGVIHGAASEAHCENHPTYEEDCQSCISLKEDVVKYQSHRHKFSCHKKNKRIFIGPDEGHGRFDGKKKMVSLELRSCRYNFPRNPLNKTEFIFGFPEGTDKKIVDKARADYEKIRKFLLRLTHTDDYVNTDRWKEFISIEDFYEFLYEVGMFETEDWTDLGAQMKARERYLTALRLILTF